MLSVAKLTVGQERYYLEGAGDRVDVADSIGDGLEDYYLDPSEARGKWAGAGARRLALGGDVGADSLRRLLAGMHPSEPEALRSDGRRVRVAAYDLTFSAPKSVSVLFGVGDSRTRKAGRAAHDAAVREAFGYLERCAASVRRGAGGRVVETADGLVAAGFRHRSSRAGDPQLHTHMVVANIAQGMDGRWSALDGRRLFAHATAASHVYQAVLRGELTMRLGVEWTAVRRGIAEVDGVPTEVMRAFSRRRSEIETAMAERGTAGPRAAEAATLATRRAKDHRVDPASMVRDWRQRAAELGWSVDQLGRQTSGRVLAAPQDVVARLVSAEGLTKKRASFTRPDVVQAVCCELRSGLARAREVDVLVEAVLASPKVVALAAGHAEAEMYRRRGGRLLRVAPDGRRYSTAELLAVERSVVEAATCGRERDRGTVAEAVVHGVLAMAVTLSDEQRAAVHALTSRGDVVAVVAGRAGTGKTYALATARRAWEAGDVEVLGVAVARRAARELERGAGIPSTSVAAMLERLARRPGLPAGAVVVVDEAGMLGTRDLARLLAHVEGACGKLVLVGDPRQLTEVDAGGVFRGLVQRGLAVELSENRRQVEPWERAAVEDLRDGRPSSALAAYAEHGRIHVERDRIATRRRLVEDWSRVAGEDCVMLAPRRVDVHHLNQLAREHLRATGRLGRDELRVAGAAFAAGDQVVIRRNALDVGVVNGDRATVTGVETHRHRMHLDVGGRPVQLGPSFLLGRRSDGEPPLTHGYAMTCHVAQGATVDRALVLADSRLCREWGYTALTRGRRENHLYVCADLEPDSLEYAPRGHAGPHKTPLETLAAALERSEAEPLALDTGRRIEHTRDRERGHGLGR